ncbi:MAG: hypothetical protein K1W16_02455 [Lachnospiraceae bacterium]|jgi:hypothetical protein
METNNEWMNDPELQKIDPSKLDFLNKMFMQSTTINNGGNQAETQKKMMAFLLSLNKLSKDNNISFHPEEVELIFSVLKKYSTPDDIAKMQKISSFFRSR